MRYTHVNTRSFIHNELLFHERPIPQKSPLVHLLINEEGTIPWLFLVDLVTTAANKDLLEQVKKDTVNNINIIILIMIIIIIIK